MKFKHLPIVLTILFVTTFAIQAVTNNPAPGEEAQTEDGINWMTIEEAAKKNKKKPRKIFVDMYTDWCGWCKVMDKKTFTDPFIIEYINANYYPVKFDAESKESLSFNGEDYEFVATQNGKGINQFTYYLVNGGRASFPTVVFIDEDLSVIQAIPGYRKPEELDKMLKYYGGNHHKKTDYTTFSREYISPYEN